MAYVRSKVLKVTFDGDHPLAGLEVRTRRLSMDAYREVMSLSSLDPERIAVDDDAFDEFRRPFEIFADCLISWNLQEEDENGEVRDVPPTLDAILADIVWIMPVIKAWLKALMEVPPELGKGSPSGEPSDPVPSLPMEPLSPSPQSSNSPN